MDEAMKIADCTYTSSQIGNFFKQFLRQKNKEVQREAEREQRNITVVSSRHVLFRRARESEQWSVLVIKMFKKQKIK